MQHKLLIACTLMVLVILAVACSSAPTPAPTTVPPTKAPAVSSSASPAGQRTPTLKPPSLIPADHVGKTECLSCHQTGANGAARVPQVPDHTAPADTKDQSKICAVCHQQAK